MGNHLQSFAGVQGGCLWEKTLECTYMPPNAGLVELWSIHEMEYYAVLKGHVCRWIFIDVENIHEGIKETRNYNMCNMISLLLEKQVSIYAYIFTHT